MDNTNSERIDKTTLSKRNAYYRYAYFNRDKMYQRFNNDYDSTQNKTESNKFFFSSFR